MSGPWEEYKQPAESGPWSDYAAQTPAPATGPELRQGTKPNLWNQITSVFRDPGKEAAEATEALVNAHALNIRPSTAHEYRGAVKKVLEMRPQEKAKRDKYMAGIQKFNDTGVKDGWGETFIKSVQRVPIQMQIAAGGLMQMMEENPSIALDMSTAMSGIAPDVETDALLRTIADRKTENEVMSIGKEWIKTGKEKLKPLESNVEPGSFQDVIAQSTDSLLTNLIYLAPSLATGNPAFALAGMGLQSTGEGYAEQRAGGMDPGTAGLAALGYGVSEVLTEFIPVGTYLKPGNSFVKRLIQAEFSEIPTETVNTLTQAVIDKVTISPEMTFADAMNRVQETIAVTAFSTLGLAGGSHTVHKVIGKTIPAGPAKDAYVAAKDAALDDGATPQEAAKAGVDAAIQTPDGAAHVEQVTARIVKEAQAKQPEIDKRAEELPVEAVTEIDEEQLDSKLDALFADEAASIEDFAVDEVEQDATPFPEVSEAPEKTILESLKAINTALGEGGFVDPGPLMDIGKTVWNEGKTKLEDFTARMKEHLGEVWEQVKEFVGQVYNDLKRILSEERGSFSTEDISRSQKQDRNAKKRIREMTGQNKGEEKTITETTAMEAAFKKAEQASKKAFKAGVEEGVKKANTPKEESVKQRVRRVTGQVKVSDLVREDEALRAAFKKAEQAGRAAYRAGNKDGIAKAKEEIKALMVKGREKKIEKEKVAKDIKAIKKLAEIKGQVAVDYQKKIKALVAGLDFTKISAAKQEELQGLADYIEENGVPLGIPEKRIKELQRLSKTALRDMSPEDIKALRAELEHLTELGKLKAELKYKYKARERAKVEDKILSTTNNIDPDVRPKDEKFRDKVKVAGTAFYVDTLHTPRVAEMADNFQEDGEQQKLIRMMGDAEQKTISTSMKRGLSFMEWLKSEGIEVIEEESETDIRMMIAMRYREGARTQAETLMEHYGIKEVPLLTEQEERIIGWIRADMERNKGKLAATWEEVVGDVFPEQEVYYLPLKYVKEEEIIPDVQTEGRGRTTHTFDGFSHARRPGVKKLPRVGILQIYQEAVLEQEWYVNVQPVLEDIKSILMTDEYKEAAGSILYNWWKDQIDIMARRGWSASAQLNAMTALLRTTRHNINKAILGFKLSTIMMQPFAVFDGMAYVNAKVGSRAAARVLGEVTKSFLIPGRTKELVAGSEALLQRQGGELAITEELQKAKGETVPDKLTRQAFKLISQTDLKTAAGVQEAVRKVFIDEGMSEAEALREAEFVMNMSQGSSSVAYRPHVLAKGEGARTWFTFQTFVLNRWGLIVHDIIAGKIKHGDIKGKMAGLISLGIIMMAGASEDEAREWLYEIVSGKELPKDNRSTVEKTFVNVVATMPFFGNIIDAVSQGRDTYPPAMQVLVKGAKGVKQLFTGKDSDKKLKGLLNALESGLAIGVGYPGTAQFFDLLERALIKEKK